MVHMFAPPHSVTIRLFSPLDRKLGLGVEGYSPRVLQLAIRQAQKAASFQDASGDLREMLGVSICPSHLQKISQRIGREWLALRQAEVKAFRDDSLASEHREAPQVAAVMVDGG